MRLHECTFLQPGVTPMRATLFPVLICLAVGLPATAAAQWRAPALESRVSRNPVQVASIPSLPRYPVQSEQTESLVNLVGGGVLAGVIGAVAGRAVAAENNASIGDRFFGASLGAGIGIPVGVHLANGRRGQLVLAELASVAWTVALFSAAAEDNSVLLLAAAPAGALAASVTIERRTRKAPTTEAVAGAQLGKCPLQDSNLGPSD